ncbi:MAG: hypothetical protein H6598_05895 [Flavobacteriales bacterium]|nr:hypothetical protein [Flavobacteriales bacterium]MCB9195734.1 hypothetical protein [Flavobacteriales bacterium]
MKKLSILMILTVLLSGLALTSCGKYEEGPGFSLLPKKSRLQQKWRPIESVTSGGVVTTIDSDGSYIEFVKGGTIKAYDGTFDVGFEGTWEFSDDKTSLNMTYEIFGVSSTSTMKIIKLKINALGLEDADGDKTYYEYF